MRESFECVADSVTAFAIFTQDRAGIVTSWNMGAERLTGYRDAEILGRISNVIFTPEDNAAGIPEAERAQAMLDGRAEDERWHLRKNGSRFWGSGLLIPLAGPDAGFVKILRDLTERHVTAKRLRENEELFRVLATNVPQLVFRTRTTGDRTWGSPQWIEFTGLDLEHSLKFGWLSAIHPDDREATVAAWSAAQEGGDYSIEHRIRRAVDGAYRWHQTRARQIESGDAVAGEMVGTSTDIHDMRNLRERQEILLAELQHRTRNLLAVVRSIAGQTLRASASLQEFDAEFGERLAALGRVQGLLARTDHQALDLGTLVEAELAAHADGRRAADKVHIEGPPAVVSAGAAQALTLALHELATNAVKYGALGQPSGQLSVTWRTEGVDAKRIVLDWRESGVVMPAGEPRRKGYGSELIERALPYQLRAHTRLQFGPDGVHCHISVPVAATGTGAGLD
ncbi:PAS domain S-box protein [Lichenicola cladoniae]|uniref:histidine kinase n=1 Tax=Lichenicola cladoniae TaxID=1484109 RepID=A0A6M8HF74_9PROT|nr:PAS domain S-box protein [Lichenicola cladoniae]NPD68558.1 PAS domain S-box protein [Acetobacteraceae bacterium]QKE88960.1 PAS domain S-box protein [Lichenicola cladoniae]